MSYLRKVFRNFIDTCKGRNISNDYFSVGVKTQLSDHIDADDKDLQSNTFYDDDILKKRQRSMTLETARSSISELKEEFDFPCDPITLEPLGSVKYTYNTSSGRGIQYNLQSFVEYLLSSIDFRDPISRSPLTEDDIMYIDHLVEFHQLNYPNLLNIFNNKTNIEIRNRDKNTLRGLEMCIGELIAEMLTIIENPLSRDQYELSVLFSEFEIPYTEMKNTNIESAYHCLKTWQAYIEGPPKKPTRDPRGRLIFARRFLKNQWTAEDQIKLMKIRDSS